MSAKIIPIDAKKGPLTIEELRARPENRHLSEEQVSQLLEDIRTLARVFLEIIFKEEQQKQQEQETPEHNHPKKKAA